MYIGCCGAQKSCVCVYLPLCVRLGVFRKKILADAKFDEVVLETDRTDQH